MKNYFHNRLPQKPLQYLTLLHCEKNGAENMELGAYADMWLSENVRGIKFNLIQFEVVV